MTRGDKKPIHQTYKKTETSITQTQAQQHNRVRPGYMSVLLQLFKPL